MNKKIKRRLMNGYVELQDGTFAKEVNGELIPVHEDEVLKLPRGYFVFADKTCAKYDATTDNCIPVSWDEAWAFDLELNEVSNETAAFSDEEVVTLDEGLDVLVRGTNEETRRFAYFWIAGMTCPEYWHAVVSCCVRDEYKYFGNNRIQSLMTNLMPLELAQEKCGELGVTSIVFLRVYKLLAAMQRDLGAGTNLDVVDFLLNEWEEWGTDESSLWDYEENRAS